MKKPPMGRSRGNPLMEPWYPWDFEKVGAGGGRDGRRFKQFLAIRTYFWYAVGFFVVPALLFGLSLPPAGGRWNQAPAWLLGSAVLWVAVASRIFKILPDQLLEGLLAVTAPRRVRLGATASAFGICLLGGALFSWIAACFQASPFWGTRFWTVVFLCPGLGLDLWALFYAVDFGRILFRKSRAYELDNWEIPAAPKSKGPGEMEVAHWSDLHLTGRDGDLSVSKDRGDNESFRRLLGSYRKDLEAVDVLLVSGDVADAGRASEWHVFFRDLPGEMFGKMVLVPGNHDMNIVDRSDWFMVEGQGRLLRKKRLIRTMAALNRVQGRRSWMLEKEGNGKFKRRRLGDYLRGYEKPFRELLDELAFLQKRKPRWWDYLLPPVGSRMGGQGKRLQALGLEVDRAWGQIFPMLVEVPGVPVPFLVLNSNKEDTGIVDNALGELSPEALERLDEMHRQLASRPVIHTHHHHVALPSFKNGFLGDVQADMMALLNAGDLVRRLLERGSSVVFHGHRHIGYEGTLNRKLQILSAPSTTLGNELHPEWARNPGFYSFRVSYKGPLRVVGRRYWGVRPPWSPPGKVEREPKAAR